MQRVDDAIVENGKITVANLPFRDGQRVHVTVTDETPQRRLSIQEVRERLRGRAIMLDDPSEPMIPIEDWEMLK